MQQWQCTVALDRTYLYIIIIPDLGAYRESRQFIIAALNILTECFFSVYHAWRIAITSSTLGSASGQSQSSSARYQLSHQHCHLLIQGKMSVFTSKPYQDNLLLS